MRRIVHINFNLKTGGAENLMVDIANEQSKFNQVSIIVINNRYDHSLLERISKNIDLCLINRKEGGRGGTLFLIRLWYFLYHKKPDIIHCHHPKIINILPFWQKKCHVTIHGLGYRVKSLNRYNKIFSISTAVQTDIWNSSKLKSEVIYNGIDLAVIKSKEQYLYDPTKDFRIVQVGRLEHLIKGQHFSIQAIAKLKALGYNNLKLYLVGNGSSRPYLKDLVHSLKAEDSILFLGEKDRSWIYNNLFDFDLMIQPSIKEGFGLTIVEGVAAGIPVIATKADGPLEVLKDCPSGFLFDSEDVDELVYLIRHVIDLTRAQKIKNLCMYSKTTANKFSINYTAAKYIQQY